MPAVALARLPAQLERNRNKESRLRRLDELAEAGARAQAAFAAFKALDYSTATPIESVARSFSGGAMPDIQDAGLDKIEPAGWIRRRVALNFEDIKLEDLWMLLRQAESQRPPWRMVRLEILSSAATSGRGRIKIVLEALNFKED